MDYMKREIERELLQWKEKKNRLPLILRGARQVGKSYIVEKFGREQFENFLTVNLELRPDLMRAFDVLDPVEILRQLEAVMNVPIKPGKTLLFIDEIQCCPRAILALRYFKEKMQELHVIAAGSLLEFALHEENFSFPVGRVQFIYLKPLSFSEFLTATGKGKIKEYLLNASLKNPIPELIHENLLKLVRSYFLIGGMPAVVQSFIQEGSFLECERLQNTILDTYRSDFGKYASKAQYKYLQKFFEQAPNLVGRHFKYVKISPEYRARDLKVALEQLCWAGLLTRVHATNASGIPLRYQIKENKFKLLLLDIGLLQRANQIDAKAILNEDLLQLNQGALAEQFVGQELLAYSEFYEEKRLYYWEREVAGSSSEVDYVINMHSKIVPIEVKAGKTGRLKSLRRFMEEKKHPVGIRVSQQPLSFDKGILSIPFYLLEQLPALLNR